MDSTTTETAVAVGVFGASILMLMLIVLGYYILLIVARWKLFEKAGVEGWKSIIPIYSDYVEWTIGWKNVTMFWVALGLVVAGAFLGGLTGQFTTTPSGEVVASSGAGFFGIICTLLMCAGGVIALIGDYKLFQSFGKGVGFFIGYLFVPNIMMLILGFGSAQYLGAQD